MALKKSLQNIKNPFWKETVSVWLEFSKMFAISDDKLWNENIFNSDFTKFSDMRYESWEKKGVRFIGDLFEQGKLISWGRFKEKYDVQCIQFEYDSLLRSLPSSLKCTQENWCYLQPPFPERLQYLMSTNTFTKYFASLLNRKKNDFRNDINRIKNKWIRDMETFDPLSVLNVKNSVCATKYTSFQFKLVMRILTTNTFLKIIGVQENEMCSFCQENPETLKHLFLTCDHVRKLWNDTGQYLSRCGIERPSENNKMFGDKDIMLVTHIVAIIKYVIYDARRKQTRPSFNHFKAFLKRDFDTEKYLARKNNKLENFEEKWKALWKEMTVEECPTGTL